jgi:hypothetical protein
MAEWTDRLRAAVYRFRLRNQWHGRPERVHRISNPWHAISVVPGEWACDAALALRDRRFLSADAPQLPLSGCSRYGVCTCHYRHHSDRRRERRRKRDSGLSDRNYTGLERRGAKRGRRATDL